MASAATPADGAEDLGSDTLTGPEVPASSQTGPAHTAWWRSTPGLATLIGALGTVLCTLGSWIPSLWGDEAASVMSAQRTLPSLFRMLGNIDAVHGLYYVGLHFWIKVFGSSPFSVRVPPAIAVGFAVAAVVMITAELADRQLAVFAGLITCVVPRVTYMGEETRTYAFGAAFAGWALWLLLRLLRNPTRARRGWWVGYAAVLTVAIYAFLYFGLFLVVHAIVIAVARPPVRFVRRWLLTMAAVLVAAAPIVVYSFLQRHQISFLAERVTTDFRSLTVGVWFGRPAFAVLAWALILVAALMWVVPLVRRNRLRERAQSPSKGNSAELDAERSLTLVALCWLLLPGLILLAGTVVVNEFTGRYLSFSAPAVGILMALAIRFLARGRWWGMVAGLLVTAVVAAPIYLSQRQPYAKNGSDWAEISTVMGAHARPGDAVVFDSSAMISRRPRLALQTYPAGFRGLKDVTLKTPYKQSDTWYDRTYTIPQAAQRRRFVGISRVWLVEYAPPGHVDTWGLADLHALGFTRRATYATYRSRILELVRAPEQ